MLLSAPEALQAALDALVENEDEDDSILTMLLKRGANLDTRMRTTVPFAADVTLLGWAVMRTRTQLVTRRLVEIGCGPQRAANHGVLPTSSQLLP